MSENITTQSGSFQESVLERSVETVGRELRGELPRLSGTLFPFERSGFGTFATLATNLQAFETAMMFAGGLVHFAALSGPSGWGKTHLLQAVATLMARERQLAVEVKLTGAWLSTQPRAESIPVLILDHAEDAFTQARTRQALRTLMERRRRLGKPTLLGFTMDRSSRAVRQILPAREWVISEIARPNRADRIHIVKQLAENHQLILTPMLIGLIARRVVGNGNSLDGAMSRLRLIGSAWESPQQEIRALGLLEPLLSMRSGWDLRDHIAEVAGSVEQDPKRAQDLAVYAMLKWVGLHESDVAAFFHNHTNDVFSSVMRCGDLHPELLPRMFVKLHQSMERL